MIGRRQPTLGVGLGLKLHSINLLHQVANLFFIYALGTRILYLTLNKKQFREIKGLFHARFTGPSCRHSIENQSQGETSGTAANPQIYRVSTEESPPNIV